MAGRVIDETAHVTTVTLTSERPVLSPYLMPLVDLDDIDIAPLWEEA